MTSEVYQAGHGLGPHYIQDLFTTKIVTYNLRNDMA